MSPTKLSKPRKRRTFTPEFKAEAVRLALTPGKTITKVARELDLTVTCLHDWVGQARIDAERDPQGALTTDERAELTRLRRELRTVEQERDFLKKQPRTLRRASRECRNQDPRTHARSQLSSRKQLGVRKYCHDHARWSPLDS